ncbi:MAG: hypothetical protein ACM3UV_08280 [Nocardioidaceae bacterium]
MTVGDRRTTVEARRTTAEALVPGFRPETELERAVAHDPELVEGLAWGRPRAGHPEGPVGAHVSHLLRTIDAWEEGSTQRSELRFVAIVHDSRKVAVHEWLPRRGENHHAMRARRLAERYTRDERLLATIELHDRPYSIWRRRHHGVPLEPALERLFARIPDPALFLRFVELDGSTEGKNSEPIDWFRHELARRALL